MLIGNKCDLDRREVSFEEGAWFAKQRPGGECRARFWIGMAFSSWRPLPKQAGPRGGRKEIWLVAGQNVETAFLDTATWPLMRCLVLERPSRSMNAF